MGRVAGRDADDTRRIILDAATELFARRGVGVSLAEIAETAGVSKGGLVYHFASKDDLVRAGALHLFERFRQAVHNEADAESEGTPGRLARGYIRASFAEAGGQDIRDLISVSAQLMADPEVRELSDADGRRWREELSADAGSRSSSSASSWACASTTRRRPACSLFRRRLPAGLHLLGVHSAGDDARLARGHRGVEPGLFDRHRHPRTLPHPGIGGIEASYWINGHALAGALVWPAILIAIFVPLSVRQFRRLSR